MEKIPDLKNLGVQKENIMQQLRVIKCDAAGNEVWNYPGKVLKQKDNLCLIEAFFDKPDMIFHGMSLVKGDRFLELYYSDRWYNLLEIHDHQTGELKGWYCNLTYPARFVDGKIIWEDLALDLLVFPDGRQMLLDEDEYAELNLVDRDKSQVAEALRELKQLFAQSENFSVFKLAE